MITLHLTGIAHGGAAFGRYEGKVIFVPYALPGETVRAEIMEDHSRYARARLVEILEPSPERVGPPCPYFGPEGCGGCHLQHATYEAQLRLKAQVVMEQLARIGGLSDPPVLPTLPDPTGWAYRNQARFHPAPSGGLGFCLEDRREVVPIGECLILHPYLSELYDALDLELPDLTALTLRAGVATGDRMLILETAEDEPPELEIDLPLSCVLLTSDGVPVPLIGQTYITERVAGHTYRVSAPSFFQANTAQAERLVSLVLDYLAPAGHEVVLDGYCGVGLFTLPLAERAGLVIAVEVNPAAVDDLLENTADRENVEVVEGPVEAVLADRAGALDAAVVDPPRTGLSPEALERLIAARPARLVYVSCDPATLARDARRLRASGYHLEKVQPVDMFPQTYHVETVSLWRI
ncbi:MAG: class I SAM-dependent RNA methyltransferase [Anaerolineae bacterium]|nr:class I SAM-dependent RNA methyltransferase [Anaerolineae bacterium]MDW8067507.1 class I SAM-dependent RNA methyltransferase [Anaerolineae bacterium]